MLSQLELKQLVAKAALNYVKPNTVLGVGTGSTVNCFIDELIKADIALTAAVSSSNASCELLNRGGIKTVGFEHIDNIDVYIDGADEIDAAGNMIKGGGAALTREKIVASQARQFVCIVDESKVVAQLGAFALPVEIVPLARYPLQRRFAASGAQAHLRIDRRTAQPVVTDNGLHILDVSGLTIDNPRQLETTISQWPGVLTVGIFAYQKADICLIATPSGVISRSF